MKVGLGGMIQFSQILTANGSALLLLLLLKLIMNRQIRIKSLIDARILSVMINLTIFQCIFDTLVFCIDGKSFPMARELNYAGNIIYYILNVTVSYFWPLFTEYKLNSSVAKLKKQALILAIPLAVSVLFIITTPLNGFIFTITEDNVYTRTGYNFMIVSGLIIFNILYGGIRVYINHSSKGKYMIFPALYFTFPILLGIAIQAFNYGISLIYIGTAIGLTGIYLSTQSESAYIDQLCGVYNRRYYNDYIRNFCNSKSKEATLWGVLIDMDNFKPINDNFGHDVGDEALILFSSVLRKYMDKAGFVVRYGGDEFILLTSKSEEVLRSAVKGIIDELGTINDSGRIGYKLQFSYGIATINGDGSSNAFLNTMDSRMYEMKREGKAVR